MVIAVRLHLDAITGPASVERCCPVACDYNPTMVAIYLSVIRQLEAAGEDVGEAAASVLAGKDRGRSAPGGSGLAHCSVKLWDVQRVLQQMGTTARRATPDDVAHRLCPWALDDTGRKAS